MCGIRLLLVVQINTDKQSSSCELPAEQLKIPHYGVRRAPSSLPLPALYSSTRTFFALRFVHAVVVKRVTRGYLPSVPVLEHTSRRKQPPQSKNKLLHSRHLYKLLQIRLQNRGWKKKKVIKQFTLEPGTRYKRKKELSPPCFLFGSLLFFFRVRTGDRQVVCPSATHVCTYIRIAVLGETAGGAGDGAASSGLCIACGHSPGCHATSSRLVPQHK